MPGFSSQGIFISYRREDAAPYARLLQFQLRERIPDARVFVDLDSIEAGLEFAEVIREAVGSCAVLVALIGQQWATLVDEEGRRRLDNPDDFVRFEIQAALERDVRVIPVLVDGARPLRQRELPAELHKLARLNALELSYGRYQYDADRLLELIQQVLAREPGSGTAHQSSPLVSTETTAVPHDVRPDGNVPGEAAKTAAEPVRDDRARAARLLGDAVRAALSITDEPSKASMLAEIAEKLAATDPDRAARLAADAERIAQSITEEHSKAWTLAAIAKELAATDPDRAARAAADAERIAQSITDESAKAKALAAIAGLLAATDPDRAARAAADAERTAQSITDESEKAKALAQVGEALAATDPDRADRIAQSITDESARVKVLAGVVEELAATDPDRAETIARSITSEYRKASALADVAKALETIDPDRAENIAQSLTDQATKARTLAYIAETLAATDPDRAARLAADTERAAQSNITDEWGKACALAYAARALAATDPDRASRAAADAERIVQSVTYRKWRSKNKYNKDKSIYEVMKGLASAQVAWTLAPTDPVRAERIARSITSQREKNKALGRVVVMLVSTDPDGAERITRSMTDGFWKAVALLHMASELQLCGNCLTKVEGKDLGVMAAQGLRSSLPGERLTIPGRYCMP